MSREFPKGFLPEIPPESAEELYENAPCGYLSTTPDGRIVRLNQTFADMTGYERSELIGRRRFSELLTIGGRIFYDTHFAPMLRMHGEVREIALELQTAGGSAVPILVSAVQKQDADGNAVVNRITVFNATDRRGYERELLAARERAEAAAAQLARVNAELSTSNAALVRANEELGQFAYAATHDLQEPLRTMTAYAQLLERRYQHLLDEQGRAFVANIVDGASRMRSLISDLLAFSQAQGAHLTLRPTDLAQVLAVALSNLHSSIKETGATITQEKLPMVMADGPRIAQVLQNLLGNAMKYRKPGEPPQVRIIAGKHDTDHWTISVQDNGMGFDSRYAEQIFGVFKRLHGRDIPGTGIGLAICKKIIESHGGRIWATSTAGVGSEISFTLPDASMSRDDSISVHTAATGRAPS